MFRVLILAALCAVCTDARPAAPLTEPEAVKLGLDVPEFRDWVAASRRESRGRTRASGLWANPELEYSEESLDVPGGSTDRFLWLRQPVDIAGVNSLRREAARESEGVVEADVEAAERERRARVRTAFYDALQARRRVEATEHWHQRLAQLARAVFDRYQAGDASRFDHLRLERERVLLQGRLESARAELNAARAQLFGLLQTQARPLTGTLLPAEPAPLARLRDSLGRHPEIRRLQSGAEADRLTARAAGREAWPDVTLGVGRRDFEEGPTSLDGNVFSVGVEIPLFDRGDGRASAARASASAKAARLSLVRAQLRVDLEATLDTLRTRRAAALSLQDQLDEGGESLSEIADASYQAGELEVMGLIDAHQAELDLRLEAIGLARAARASATELMKLTGE